MTIERCLFIPIHSMVVVIVCTITGNNCCMRTGLYMYTSDLGVSYMYIYPNYEILARMRRLTDEMRHTFPSNIWQFFVSIPKHSFTFEMIFFCSFFSYNATLSQFPERQNPFDVWQPYGICVLELHNLLMNLLHLFLHHSDVFFISKTEWFGTWEFSYSFRIVTFI